MTIYSLLRVDCRGGYIMGKIVKKYKDGMYQFSYQLDRSESLNYREVLLLSNPGITSIASLQVGKHKSRFVLSCQFNNHMELTEYIKKPISENEFFSLMRSIANILVMFTKLQMEQQQLVMNQDYIFVDRSTKTLTVIYLPILQCTKLFDVPNFLLNLFNQLHLSSNQTMIRRYIEFIESGRIFNSLVFEKFTAEQSTKYSGESVDYVNQSVNKIPLDEFKTLPETFFQKKNETKKKVYLMRISTREVIPIEKKVFRIGKDREKVDYAIIDNDLVSGVHADIINKDKKYYICDNYSTNRTYLDDNVVVSQREQELVSGSRLTFADEEFEFFIE